MEMQTDYVEPATPALSYNASFSKAEDSGYHTFTPGSFECTDISKEYLDQSVITSKDITGITGHIKFGYFHVTPEVNNQLGRRYHSTTNTESLSDTPTLRRGCKRPYSSTTETAETFSSSVPTPTSFIAGKIKSLDVNENKENSDILSPVGSQCSAKIKRRLHDHHDFEQILSYPTTPVKRNCKRSPCRRSGKKVNLFTIHSLSCETNKLQSTNNIRAASKAVRNINFWPDKKIDIIQKLYYEAHAIPPVMQILCCLSNEDIHNFKSVSKVWNNIWESIPNSNKKKKEFEGYLKTIKENQENRDKGVTRIVNDMKPVRCLREIHNEVNNPVKVSGSSPPSSPRTNKFKKFAKSASLDSRSQLSCVRCCQPAKVNEETSGEMWVECTSNSCSYQFCKFCKCNRHPGKICFQYDYTVPSPSKRKNSQSQYAIGTKKSKRNLLRL